MGGPFLIALSNYKGILGVYKHSVGIPIMYQTYVIRMVCIIALYIYNYVSRFDIKSALS